MQSFGIQNCTLCDIGQYCSQKGLTAPDGVCEAGYFCISGAADESGTIGSLGGSSEACKSGYYCPRGTTSPQQTLNVVGTGNITSTLIVNGIEINWLELTDQG